MSGSSANELCRRTHKVLSNSIDVFCRPLLPLFINVPFFINFLRRAQIDVRDGRSLPFLVLWFRCLRIQFSFNKPWHMLYLFLRCSHFYFLGVHLIIPLLIKRVHEIHKCNQIQNFKDYWIHRTNLIKMSHLIKLALILCAKWLYEHPVL